MSEKPDVFVGGWSDACQCDECRKVSAGHVVPARPALQREDCEVDCDPRVACACRPARMLAAGDDVHAAVGRVLQGGRAC